MKEMLDIAPCTTVRQTSEPKDLSEDRGVLQQRLLAGGKPIKARSDDSLDGLRNVLVVRGTLLDEHLRELLGIQRVPARAAEQGALTLRLEDGSPQERGKESRRGLVGKRRERKRR